MMAILSNLLVLLLSALVLAGRTASAYPNGAGSCVVGNAAVDESHLQDAKTGSLHEGNIIVKLNKLPVYPEVATAVEAEQTYSLEVHRKEGFRGVLVRVQGPDDRFSFLPNKHTQDADECHAEGDAGNVVGITHSHGNVKKTASGEITFAAASGQADDGEELRIDVTVVVSNNEPDGSEFYYSTFTNIRVEDPATVASAAAIDVTKTSSSGANPGVVVISILLVLLVGFLLYYFFVARKNKQGGDIATVATPTVQNIQNTIT